MNIRKILSAAAAAAVMLSSAPAIPLTQPAEATGAKSRVSIHDPSIIKANDGTYYVFGSHIDAAKSTDLQNWRIFSNGYATVNNVEFGDLSRNLAGAFAWAGEDLEDCEGGFAVWAPDVIYNPDFVNSNGSKGAYMMYFCTSSTYMRSVIGYAVSQNIEGPYTFVDTLIYSGFTEGDSWAESSTKRVNRKYTSTNIDELVSSGEVTFNQSWFRNGNYNNSAFPNAIDPTIYYGTDGKMYMCYGSWSGGIFTLEIDKATGRCIHPRSGKTSDGRMIDSYFGTLISGGYGKSGEGPFIEYNAETGYYYLWVTYGGLFSDGGYNMRVFRSTNPTGPFTDPAGRQAVLGANTNLDSVGLKVMGNHKFSSYKTAYMACGHNSVLRDDDGKWYLFNHARFDDGTEYHEVRVHSMYFNEEGWPVVAPFEYSGDEISPGGYETEDIAGDYEYINHGNDTGATIYQSTKITLSANGKISGAVTGTWEQSPDSPAAMLNIGGQQYSGYFMAIQDETGSGTKHMTFTAVGSNNQTVWGAKNMAYTGTDRAGLGDYTNKDAQLVMASETVQDPGKAVKLSGTELLSGVNYFITNKNSGLAIDLPDGKLDNGTNIQQWDQNKLWAQQWRLVAADEEYFRIVSLGDESKCIAVAESSASDGINVELQTYTGADNQLFKLVKSGVYYGILSKCSGGKGALDVFEWSTKNGGNINQYAYHEYDCQLWKIAPVCPAVNDGDYIVRSINSGKFMSQDSGNVIQNSEMSPWHIESSGDGTYTVSDSRGRYLTVEEGSAADGANISLATKNGGDSQKFAIKCNKDGSYSLMTAVSGEKSCLDIFEISYEDGANICQWEFWGGDGQKFVLEPTSGMKRKVVGDVNADGEFTVADLVMTEKFLLGTGTLTDWMAGDLCEDGTVNTFDLVEMRKLIIA